MKVPNPPVLVASLSKQTQVHLSVKTLQSEQGDRNPHPKNGSEFPTQNTG